MFLGIQNQKIMKKMLFLFFGLAYFGGASQCPNSIFLISQAEVDNFIVDYPNCTEIHSLTVAGPDISNLYGLRNLEFINWFNITSPVLQNFEGMGNLVHVNSFRVGHCDSLVSFYGLYSLTSLGKFGMAYDNKSLTSFSGLESLTTVTYDFDIRHAFSLTSLDGLKNLKSVGGKIFIMGNSSLTSIEGLNNIESSRIDILGNLSLSNCATEAICTQLRIDPMLINVGDNAPGCNSRSEILGQCELSITEADFNKSLSIYPNPVTSILNINTSNHISFEKAIVYSTLGKEILQTSKKEMNLETLSTGIYFVEVVTGKGSVTKRIVKK